jgi:hypothetical protein
MIFQSRGAVYRCYPRQHPTARTVFPLMRPRAVVTPLEAGPSPPHMTALTPHQL